MVMMMMMVMLVQVAANTSAQHTYVCKKNPSPYVALPKWVVYAFSEHLVLAIGYLKELSDRYHNRGRVEIVSHMSTEGRPLRSIHAIFINPPVFYQRVT